MGTIIVEQFNPANGYWNKLYEVDESEFDENASITVSKYDGPYRTYLVGESIKEEIIEKKQPKRKNKVVEDDPIIKSVDIIWD